MTSTEPPESFQIPTEAAEAYEATFVPGFFAQWAPVLCDEVGLVPGHQVVDVGCGTGIVARTAADRVGPANVIGVDVNEAMLLVARRLRPDIDWRQGDAGALPVGDAAADAVLSQMALMFFPDRARAAREMARVARPGGAVGILVPSSLERQPAYGPFVDMASDLVGDEARSLLSAYFACGDLEGLGTDLTNAGLVEVNGRVHLGTTRFPSIEALVSAEVDSTPLGERISESVRAQLLTGAQEVLREFTASDGRLEAPFAVNVVVGQRP